MSTRSPFWWRRTATIAALAGAAMFTLMGCGTVGADLVSYEDLPEDQQRYTLEVETDGVTTAWEYTSGKPTERGAPEAQPCMGEALGDTSAGECRPEPLIFLKYDLNLALDDTAPAGQAHEITVTGYYQERLSEPPQVTDLQVEASFDGGTTWEQVTTEAEGDNTFTVEIPSAGGGAESASLRVSGTDSDGNTVVQTMPEAYSLG